MSRRFERAIVDRNQCSLRQVTANLVAKNVRNNVRNVLNLYGTIASSKNGLFPSGKEQSGLPLGNNVFAVGVAERAEGFKTSWMIDGVVKLGIGRDVQGTRKLGN